MDKHALFAIFSLTSIFRVVESTSLGLFVASRCFCCGVVSVGLVIKRTSVLSTFRTIVTWGHNLVTESAVIFVSASIFLVEEPTIFWGFVDFFRFVSFSSSIKIVFKFAVVAISAPSVSLEESADFLSSEV